MGFEFFLILLTLSALLFTISDVQKLKRENKELLETSVELKKEIEEIKNKVQ